jgi:hypothetical protein
VKTVFTLHWCSGKIFHPFLTKLPVQDVVAEAEEYAKAALDEDMDD